MQKGKGHIRQIALLMAFILTLANASFGANYRVAINYQQPHLNGIGMNHNIIKNTQRKQQKNNIEIATKSNVATASNLLKMNGLIGDSLIDLTAVNLTDWSGNNLPNPVPIDTDVQAAFTFSISDEAQEGDSAYIYLPEEIEFVFNNGILDPDTWFLNIYDEHCILLKDNENPNTSHDLHEPGNSDHDICLILTVIYHQAEHAFQLVFANYVEEMDDVQAYFKVQGHFNEDYIKNNDSDGWIFFGTGEKEYDYEIVFAEPEPIEIIIKKDGQSLGYDTLRDAYVLEWTVAIDPNGKALTDFIITDQLMENLEYIDNSTKILSGDKQTAMDMSDWETSFKRPEGNLTWMYKSDKAITEVFYIIFQTEIKSVVGLNRDKGNNYIFTNQVVYQDEDGSNTSPEATVKESFLFMMKDGSFDLESRTITWKVIINSEALTVSQSSLILYDEMPEGLTLLKDSVLITSGASGNQQKWDGNYFWWEENHNDEWRGEDTGSRMGIKLGKLYNPMTKTLTLTYQTTLDDVFFEQYIEEEMKLTNLAYLEVNGSGWWPGLDVLPDVSKNVNIYNTTLTKRSEGFIAQDSDADDSPTIAWKIEFQIARNDSEARFKIEDVPIAGLDYLKDSLFVEMKKGNGFSQLEEEDYTLLVGEKPDGSQTISIVFDCEVIGPVRIIFKTKVTDYELLRNGTDMKNNVNLYEQTKNDGWINLAASVDDVQRNYSLVEKSGSYDYTTKVFSYNIEVNGAPDKHPEDILYLPGSTIVEDTLPEGMRIIAETIRINQDICQPEDYEIEYIDGQQVITFHFKDLKKTVVITFDATFTDEYLNDIFQINKPVEIINKVDLATEAFTESFTDTDKKIIENDILKKTGKSIDGEGYIQWTVYINMNQVTMETLAGKTLVDQLEDGLTLAVDTIAFYTATLEEDGQLTKDALWELTADNLNYDREKNRIEFILPAKAEADQAYILEFCTDIEAEDESRTFSNTIKMAERLDYESESQVAYKAGSASGGGSGTRRGRKLTVLKQDEETNEPLADAIFTLESSMGDVKTAVSGADGEAVFTEVMATSKYTLTEVEAPEGYILNNDKIEITNTQTEVKWDNKKIKGDVKIIKYGEDGSTPLNGAKFQVQYGEGNIFADKNNQTEFITENGIAIIQGLEYGTEYKIIETEAPTGYAALGELGNYTFSFAEDGEILVLTYNNEDFIRNEKIKGAVEIYKTDMDGKPLAEAVFKLKRTDSQLPEGYDSIYEPGLLGPTGEDGYARLENLEYGTYDVYEKTAPDGYQPITTKIDTIEIRNHGETAEINNGQAIHNQRITGNLEIRKVSEPGADQINHPLSGAKFRLIRKDENLPQYFTPELIYEAETDEKGSGIITNIEYGTYRIYEIQAPYGYILGDGYIGEVTIDSPEQSLVLTFANGYPRLANQRITGEVLITKKGEPDSQGERPLLAGAEFILERIPDEKLDSGFPAAYTLVTGADGTARLTDITFGSYLIYETKAPLGYEGINGPLTDKDDKPLIIFIGEEMDEAVEIELYNEIIRRDLQVIKTNTAGTLKLKGAKFQLYQTSDLNGIFAEEVLLHDNLVTDENGEIYISDLEYGEYYLQEIQAPSGYYLPGNTKTYFSVQEDELFIQLQITNQRRNTGGGSTPTTAAPTTSAEESTNGNEQSSSNDTAADESSAVPEPGAVPGYTVEYDEENEIYVLIGPDGKPTGWYHTKDEALAAIPGTGDRALAIVFTILLVGAGMTVLIVINSKKYKKRKR